MPLSSDIAHAQVTMYVKSSVENKMLVWAQAQPQTSFMPYKPQPIGQKIKALEEPLVWRTLLTGKMISGQREWALGVLLDMNTFPLHDGQGNIIAAVSFEAASEETRDIAREALIETAYFLLKWPKIPVYVAHGNKLYRRLVPSDGVVISDAQGKIIAISAAASNIYKILGVGSVIGRRVFERDVALHIALQALNTKEPCEREWEATNMVLVQRAIPIIKAEEVLRIITVISDVTELKKKEKELLVKAAVIQEIHHRVKNNLQTIASLLRLQARRSQSEEVKAALREGVNRILSISIVHEFLSQQDKEYIDVKEVAKNILELVIESMTAPDFIITVTFEAEEAILPSEQATSVALAINELLQNSIEHGFVGRQEGSIGIKIQQLATEYVIEIYDNGIGIPADFDQKASKSLGLQIIKTLIESDLGGHFRIYADHGTHAELVIPHQGGA